VAAPLVELGSYGTRVRVPMRGSDAGMSVYALSSPGIAINLPDATTSAPFANLGIHQGAVTRLWLRPLQPRGVQVRVITRRAVQHHLVRFDERGLELTLQ
jgi:hypothetical protein